ncbi:sugar ABC transporter substrate-binding protein [Kribbella sp. NPDC050820]|uniref:sugar ABC transporter substrate-binding protein n=1 Tax=Kribbella sp. NPDC050820 TaxID=3155408 RepID=UPI00340A8D66
MKRTSFIARTCLAVAALAVPAVLSGCGGSSGTGSQAVTSISVLDWYNDTDYGGKGVIDVLNKCAAKAGVTLDRQQYPGSSYMTKILQQASSKTLPDLLLVNNPYVQELAATGALAPLSDFNISTDGYSQGILKAGTYDGKLYGLAPAVTTVAFVYNKDLLAKAGVQPPTTWDELKAAAAKLTTGKQYGVAFPAATATSSTPAAFVPFMWSNGGDEKNIATPETAEALQLWTDLVKSGSASSGVLNWSMSDSTDQFVARKAAMAVAASWAIPVLDKAKGLNYGFVRIPVKSASDTAVSLVAGETWMVPQTGNKAKQAKAAEIIACLNSDEMQPSIAKVRGYVPSKMTLASRFVADNPNMAVFTDVLKTGRALNAELGADWPKAETKISTAIQTALAGKASPSDALKQAQDNG